MRVAYLTTDEVNQELALQMAQECGLTLCLFEPRDEPPGNDYDAVLYDWDHWPAERRNDFLADLRGGSLPHRVAVHGYNLADDEVAALRTHGWLAEVVCLSGLPNKQPKALRAWPGIEP